MKKILVIFILFFAVKIYSQPVLSGTYMIGDKKVSIGADEISYWLTWDSDKHSDRLQYEENTPENDQIWLLWYKGMQSGTLVLKSDYSSGTYTDYRTEETFTVKKIEK